MNSCSFLDIVFIICALGGLLSRCNAQCTAGQYLIGQNDCKECPSGTYMDLNKHSKTKCLGCTKKIDHKYKELHSCNSTHDAVYQCANGSFNNNGHPVVCQECQVCDHVVINCTSVDDAICCPHEDMAAQKSNGTCETYSLDNKDNKDYCCVYTQSRSTSSSSSSEHSTGQESISFVTRVEESSSTALMNLSESGSSNSSSSAGNNMGIIVGCPIAGVVIVAAVVIVVLCIRSKRMGDRLNRSNGVSRRNEHEFPEMRLLRENDEVPKL